MVLTFSGRSRPSALAIAAVSDIRLNRGPTGIVNWGRATANTRLNPDISNSTNKRVMRELFREHDVPMPRLLPGDQYCNMRYDEFPIVGRPDTHSKGRGFWLCRTNADVQRALRGTRRKKAATHFMEFIDAPHEYRCHIFLGKSIRISEKLPDSHGATAHGDYTTIKPTGPVKHVRTAAKAAVAALGLDFGTVDILATDTQAWVLEVNCAPGLGGTMPKLWADTFNNWYEEGMPM